MKKDVLKNLGVKSLWLSGGVLRLALGGIGASLASFLLIERLRRRPSSGKPTGRGHQEKEPGEDNGGAT